MKTTHGLFSTLVLLGACSGGSDLDPGAGNDPGTGTSTLRVSGDARARPRGTNGRTAGDFDTELSVYVTRGQAPVIDAAITVTSASGTVTLVHNPENRTDHEGRYEGSSSNYDEVYILDVDAGADNLLDVRVDGPDIHVFRTPTAGATVDRAAAIEIEWDRGSRANGASVWGHFDGIEIEDSGTYSLPANSITSGDRNVDIHLERTNSVTPRGAAAGSEWEVTVENEIEVIAL